MFSTILDSCKNPIIFHKHLTPSMMHSLPEYSAAIVPKFLAELQLFLAKSTIACLTCILRGKEVEEFANAFGFSNWASGDVPPALILAKNIPRRPPKANPIAPCVTTLKGHDSRTFSIFLGSFVHLTSLSFNRSIVEGGPISLSANIHTIHY